MSWDKIRSEAFGEIGLLPKEFYRMRWQDYVLLRKGFKNKQISEQRLARRIVSTICAAWLTKPVNWYDIFPIDGDKELRALIEEHQKKITEETLRMHRIGGFEYVSEIINGKMVVVKRDILN